MPVAGGRASSVPLMGREEEPTLFEISRSGRSAASFRATDIPEWSADELVAPELLRNEPLELADVSERDVAAHVTRMSHRQYAVDLGAYPLGSCTMKYNPKVCDEVASLVGFGGVHPAAPTSSIQGWLELLVRLEEQLLAVTGMAAATLQPPAGASGELTGLLLVRAWHEAQGRQRSKVIIPDSAHGTNPASVTLGGYTTVTIPTDPNGLVDLDALNAVLDEDVAAIMLTNPNTLGLFERDIAAIADAVHNVGGLLYYDGANFNAILGAARPGDMGFDIVHLNLHKTFAVPHGGGGPGAGPVAVAARLAPFLPGPIPKRLADGTFGWNVPPQSIGRVHGGHGNSLALVRAFAYILLNGGDGLQRVSEGAVLNARWLAKRLEHVLPQAFDEPCMHEFVASMAELKKSTGAKALDVAKGLIEHGFHPPTTYFPLIVDEALMIEPTETESLETLEAMAKAFEAVVAQASADLSELHDAPHLTPVRRLDEASAARDLVPTYDARHPSP